MGLACVRVSRMHCMVRETQTRAHINKIIKQQYTIKHKK